MIKNKLAFMHFACCLAIVSVASAYTDDLAFEAYKPRVLVTPDNFPVLSWRDPGVDREVDPSKLNQLDICTPGACPQEAVDAGAAYYNTTTTAIAYYDKHGRLVGTSAQPPTSEGPGGTPNIAGVAGTTTDTDAGVPAPGPFLVGAAPGALQVLPSGAATYRIPIDIPPGTAGTQPQLALSYNSQGGNGLLGVGWSLEGMSAITRCPQTFAQDDRHLGVTFTSTDRFCLDGKRLVVVPGTGAYGADGSEYRTEIDSFTKIVAKNQQGGGPAWFEVKTKSGEVLQYGFTNDPANDDDARIEALQMFPPPTSPTPAVSVTVLPASGPGTSMAMGVPILSLARARWSSTSTRTDRASRPTPRV